MKKFMEIMAEELSSASAFEIHCWNEEHECIDLAMQFGSRKDYKWDYGIVIAGEVNPKFINWLMGLPKPIDTEIYNKMTPFFTIALDNGFCSAHYGTELSKE